MSLIRLQIDLAIPKEVFDRIPQEKLDAAKSAVRVLKALAVTINKDKPNEEMTVRAKYHICHHDDGSPCEPEQDI